MQLVVSLISKISLIAIQKLHLSESLGFNVLFVLLKGIGYSQNI